MKRVTFRNCVFPDKIGQNIAGNAVIRVVVLAPPAERAAVLVHCLIGGLIRVGNGNRIPDDLVVIRNAVPGDGAVSPVDGISLHLSVPELFPQPEKSNAVQRKIAAIKKKDPHFIKINHSFLRNRTDQHFVFCGKGTEPVCEKAIFTLRPSASSSLQYSTGLMGTQGRRFSPHDFHLFFIKMEKGKAGRR